MTCRRKYSPKNWIRASIYTFGDFHPFISHLLFVLRRGTNTQRKPRESTSTDSDGFSSDVSDHGWNKVKYKVYPH